MKSIDAKYLLGLMGITDETPDELVRLQGYASQGRREADRLYAVKDAQYEEPSTVFQPVIRTK